MCVGKVFLAFFEDECFCCKVAVPRESWLPGFCRTFCACLHCVCPLPMVSDRRPVWHGFYASTILLVFFYLFRAALAPVQLLTWPLGAGASPGLLGGFGAEKSVCSCCPGAAQQEILRSIKWDVDGRMAVKNLNKQTWIAGAHIALTWDFLKVLRSCTIWSLLLLTNRSGRAGCWKMSHSDKRKHIWLLHQWWARALDLLLCSTRP